MRLLLDTDVVLWRFSGLRTLGPVGQEALRDASEVAVSVIAFVEIGIKVSVGKLDAPADLQARIADDGARILSIKPGHGIELGRLPLHHRDPFDRLLIAQALDEDLTILTPDAAFAAYGVRTLDPLR